MPDHVKFHADVFIGGTKSQTRTEEKKLEPGEILELTITSELDNPDTCSFRLSQSATQKYGASLTMADPLTVRLSHNDREKPDTSFVGEITAIEPVYAGSENKDRTLIVTGLNGMHRLSRGKRSCTYLNDEGKLTDKDIVTDLLKRYAHLDSEPVFGDKDNSNTQPPVVNYFHVFQHNQTDLEFLRLRAARIGCYILVRDKKLIFSKRDNTLSRITLSVLDGFKPGGDTTVLSLESFSPRVSTANQITQVQVRSFMPDQRQHLVCVAPDQGSSWPKLGPETGSDATKEMYKNAVVVRVDIPFSTKEEGNAIAMSILNERLLDYVQAEGSLPGDPRIKPGMVVDVVTGDARFDGPYFITYVRHHFHHQYTTFTTEFRASRDAIEKPSKRAAKHTA